MYDEILDMSFDEMKEKIENGNMKPIFPRGSSQSDGALWTLLLLFMFAETDWAKSISNDKTVREVIEEAQALQQMNEECDPVQYDPDDEPEGYRGLYGFKDR